MLVSTCHCFLVYLSQIEIAVYFQLPAHNSNKANTSVSQDLAAVYKAGTPLATLRRGSLSQRTKVMETAYVVRRREAKKFVCAISPAVESSKISS